MTVWQFLGLCAGWLFYAALLGIAGGLFVAVLYAVLRSIRWIWEHHLS